MLKKPEAASESVPSIVIWATLSTRVSVAVIDSLPSEPFRSYVRDGAHDENALQNCVMGPFPDSIVLHRTVVDDGALSRLWRPPFRRPRDDRRKANITNVDAAVWLRRFHQQKDRDQQLRRSLRRISFTGWKRSPSEVSLKTDKVFARKTYSP